MTEKKIEIELDRVEADPPTQAIRPWRSTLRTMIAASIAFIPVGQLIARETEIDTLPYIASFLALGTVITRVMAMPVTEAWLRRYAPWLAADVYRGKHRTGKKDEPYPIADYLD